jgi:galactokinase/mevalonate kinase-like predicted kinase
MRYRLTVPARINILGNPSDANEGDFATISAAMDVRAGAIVEPATGLVLEAVQHTDGHLATLLRLEFDQGDISLPYTGELDLLKAAVNRLHEYSAEFRVKFAQRGVHLATWTDVPRQSGLGGSSLFVLLTLAGLRAFYDLDPQMHNDYVLAELTQRAEAKELGITCGFADRYVPLFGGIAYLDYRGKLHHRSVNQEPYATYERLDPYVEDLPLVAISTGIERDSGDVHGRMRPRYLEEHDAWVVRGGEAPPMVRFMSGAWQTAWQGKIALLQGDLETFGALMNENHRLVNEMMAYCSFEDGAGWANNLLIETALKNGALGAKLTGAGAGGSVFALTRPGHEGKLMELWRQTAAKAGLTAARIYRPNISCEGLLLEAE